MGCQLDRLMPFWQPANILHSVLIFMLLWQINIVVVLLTYLLRRRRSTRFSKSVMVSVADNKPRLRWTWGQNQRPLQKRVADTGSDSDSQHCWKRVRLPARQRASIPCSSDGRTSARETSEFISPDMWPANSLPWSELGGLPHLHGAWCRSKCIQDSNPARGRVVTADGWDMAWVTAERGGWRHWPVANKARSL